MENIINKIKVDDDLFDLQAASAMTAEVAKTAEVVELADGYKMAFGGKKNNFQIESLGVNTDNEGRKLNFVSAGDIQVKTGKGATLQLDCESNDTADENEYAVKVCNGAMNKTVRVVGLKLNAAELAIDTQNANTTAFDKNAIDVKFRCDKWNGGVESGAMGPIYAKMKARAFDFRCYDHGGIALQIAGKDSSSHENKIKFESDRTSEIGEAAAYCGEGGKGVEFGTFNNLHTSLYTGDYRFKGDAKVYGATRGAIVEDGSKSDYPTQADDFKDIVDENNAATWNEIIAVAKAYANNEISNGVVASGASVEELVSRVSELETTVATLRADIDASLARVNELHQEPDEEPSLSGETSNPTTEEGTEGEPTTE